MPPAPRFPSDLRFASLLHYSPRGSSEISVLSQDITRRIKNDKFLSDGRNAIEAATEHLVKEIDKFPFLHAYFGPHVTLIPVPRNAPMRAGWLWSPFRICSSFAARGLADAVLPCLVRKKAVTKSATAGPGKRPKPKDHYDTTNVIPSVLVPTPSHITLVDDVITQGSTFVGIIPRLQEAFPQAELRCFALIRTESSGEVSTIVEPVEGHIQFDEVTSFLKRVP